MTSQITEITLKGAAVSLSQVEYAIAVSHGRSDVTDSATASNASLTFIGNGELLASAFVGDMLTITAYGVPRFTGRVTDVNLSHVYDGLGRLSIQAIGKVSRLGNKYIGAAPFPVETTRTRAESVFGYSGEDYIVEGGYTTTVNSLDVDNRSILDILQELADDAGAAIFDKPDGHVVFQSYDARGIKEYYERWVDQPASAKWKDEIERWEDKSRLSPTSGIPLALDANSILWEPEWTAQSGNIINKVTLTYDGGGSGPGPGPGGSHVYTVEDTDSQADYGLRTLAKETQLHDLASAQHRAGQILSQQSQPRWKLGGVELYMERVSEPKLSQILGLTCGNRVVVQNLPYPAPAKDWVGVVEGWQETYTGIGNDTGTHRLTLALSDPLASYAGMVWDSLGIQKWNTINTSVIWADAITLQDLV